MSWPVMADRMLAVGVRTFSHTTPARASRVEYLPRIGAPYFISAVFDKAHISVDPATGAAVSSTSPIMGVQLSAMEAEPAKGDRVRVDGVLYTVAEFQPDGVAGALLALHKL